MKALIVVLAAILGFVLGAVFLSLFTLGFYAIFFPDALNDGQLAMVFLITVPMGGVLGTLAGIAIALRQMGQSRTAGEVCRLGGGTTALITALYTALVALAGESPLRDFLSALLLPWVGCPFVWALLLAFIGQGMLNRSDAPVD